MTRLTTACSGRRRPLEPNARQIAGDSRRASEPTAPATNVVESETVDHLYQEDPEKVFKHGPSPTF
jgi:hypothetical protein